MLVGTYGINPGLCVGVGVGGWATVGIAVGVGTGVWGGIPEVGGRGTRLKSLIAQKLEQSSKLASGLSSYRISLCTTSGE
jgi:hypothetical protein